MQSQNKRAITPQVAVYDVLVPNEHKSLAPVSVNRSLLHRSHEIRSLHGGTASGRARRWWVPAELFKQEIVSFWGNPDLVTPTWIKVSRCIQTP